MIINNVNNTNDVDVLPSIAQKTKKSKGGDFATFFKNLGKTDKAKTLPLSTSKDSTKDIKSNDIKIPTSKINNPLVSNLLNTHNDAPKANIHKVAQTNQALEKNVESIESKPSLSQHKNIKASNNSPIDKTKLDILNTLLQDKSMDKNPKNDIKKVALSEDMPVENTANEIKNTKEDKDSAISKNTKNISNGTPNNTPHNVDSVDNIKDKDSSEANVAKPNNQDSIISPQNIGQFSTLSDDDVKLPIKDVLKYGAFKAFDALSLLKPSDGKKLSDLIKKADELALNLEKIKLQTKDAKPPLNNKITENLDIKNSNLQNQLNDMKTTQAQENINKNTNQPPQVNSEVAETKLPNENKNDIKNDTQNAPQVVNKQVANKDILKEMLNSNAKDSKQDTQQKNTQNNQAKIQTPKETINNPQNMPNTQQLQQDDLKPVNFKQNEIKETKEIKNSDEIKSNAMEKSPDSTNNIKNEQMQKIADTKETMRNFVTQLRQEIVNYKPPLSKVTLELNPANLGSVEVSITHQGKNIQVQLNANQSTINLFIQNQSDLRTALSQIGYENITMSFSNGSQMGYSDNKGKWSYQNIPQNTSTNSDTSNMDIASMDITIVNNYA